MFKNLKAEQARKGLTNQQVADELQMSRASYENKQKTGKFVIGEANKLCKLFNCDYDYLFATE